MHWGCGPIPLWKALDSRFFREKKMVQLLDRRGTLVLCSRSVARRQLVTATDSANKQSSTAGRPLPAKEVQA